MKLLQNPVNRDNTDVQLCHFIYNYQSGFPQYISDAMNEFKYKRRIRQEYFAVCGEHAFRHEIVSQRILHTKPPKIIDSKLPF